jgi:hypothetical protein
MGTANAIDEYFALFQFFRAGSANPARDSSYILYASILYNTVDSGFM